MFKMLKKKFKDQKGLTLVELLAVIVILGIIAAIAIPSIGSIIQKSKANAIKADAMLILNAPKLYVADEGVPAAPLTAGNLEPEYIDNITTFDDAYTVTVTADGNVSLSTAASKPAVRDNVSITFTSATVEMINSSADNDYDIQ